MINIIKEETIKKSVKVLLSDILKYYSLINDMHDDNVLDDDKGFRFKQRKR